MEYPLEGIRVLDLSGALGAYSARLLADLGADVTKVEPPDGDPMRRRPPLRDGRTGPEASLVFATYHANKRGITLDVGSERALPLLTELGASCDVVVLSPSRRAPVIGFDRDVPQLSWAPEQAIVCAITPFGLTGPYRDYRATAFTSYAMSGLMHRVGPPEGPPVAPPGQQQWDEAGIHGAAAVVAALHARPAVGGQLIDLAVHEVAAAKDYLLERYDLEALGTWGRVAGVGIPPTGLWRTADGPLEISAHQVRHWDAFLEMLDRPEELSEPALADPIVRRDLFDSLSEIIDGLVGHRSRTDLFERGQKAGLPCSPNHTVAEFAADPQPNARSLFVETDKDGIGPTRIPWGALHASPELTALRRPAPTLGQHNVDVYVGELGYTYTELARWKGEELV